MDWVDGERTEYGYVITGGEGSLCNVYVMVCACVCEDNIGRGGNVSCNVCGKVRADVSYGSVLYKLM